MLNLSEMFLTIRNYWKETEMRGYRYKKEFFEEVREDSQNKNVMAASMHYNGDGAWKLNK